MAASSSDAHPQPIYNARFRLVAPLLDADGDLVSPSSPDSEISQDQGTFADCTNEATEIATSSGMVYLDLTAGEMDTKCSTVIIKSTGAKTTPIVLYPVRLPVIRAGTAQAGGASTITLDSGASAIDSYYNGCYINITNNSPSNAQGQARRIVGYVGSTKVATVEGTYGTNPSNASTFEILVTAEWYLRFSDIVAIGGVSVSTSTAQLGVNVVNAAGTAWNSGGITANTLAADTLTAAKIAADVTTELQNGLATAASIAALNNLSAAQVNAEVDTALADYDSPTNAEMEARTLVAANYATAATQTTILNRLGAWTGSARNTILGALQALFRKDTDASVPSDVNADLGSGAGVANNTTDSLEAIRDRGDAAWTTGTAPTAATIADAVWDEAIADHQGAGSTGEALNAAGGAGTPPTVVEIRQEMDANSTQLAAIVADTNELQTDWVNGGRLDNILDARASQTSVDDLPTNAELATSQAAADDVTLAAIAALNNLSAGQIRTELATELGRIDAAVSTRATPAQVNTEADTALADVGLTTTITGRIDAAVSTRASQTSLDTVDDFLDTEIAAIKAKTDNLPASPAAVGSAMTLTSGERDSIAAALLDLANGVETSVTVRQALRAIAATLAGQIADAATTTNTFKAIGNAGTTRLTSTVDEDGNRTGVALNL